MFTQALDPRDADKSNLTELKHLLLGVWNGFTFFDSENPTDKKPKNLWPPAQSSAKAWAGIAVDTVFIQNLFAGKTNEFFADSNVFKLKIKFYDSNQNAAIGHYAYANRDDKVYILEFGYTEK